MVPSKKRRGPRFWPKSDLVRGGGQNLVRGGGQNNLEAGFLQKSCVFRLCDLALFQMLVYYENILTYASRTG